MKNILTLFLFAFLFVRSVSLHASDTLTRAQIYNFSVGDTFDYEEHYFWPGGASLSNFDTLGFRRCVISNIRYSQNNDTLFISRQWVYPLPIRYDTLILDSLQNIAVYLDSVNTFPGVQSSYSFDTTSQFNHAPLNGITIGYVSEGYIQKNYGLALGDVCSVYGKYGVGPFSTQIDSVNLIYYSKSTGSWGVPYHIANCSQLIHYTPIPEQNAVWINNDGGGPGAEKISTGSRIVFNGHSYVELLYTTNIYPGRIIIDSLIGYFRNDTSNRKAYLYSGLDSIPFLTYDFSIPAGGDIQSLTTVTVGGQPRICWNEDCTGNIHSGYIEGVGGITGFLNDAFYPQYDNTGPCYCTLYNCGALTCFSVEGQVLYPDPASDCNFSLGTYELSPPHLISIYPNPTNGTVNFTGSKTGYTLQIYNVLGEIISFANIDRDNYNTSLVGKAKGIYFYRITNNSTLVQQGKIILE